MAGNSVTGMERKRRENGHEPVYFGQTDRMYRLMDLFTDTVLFEYSYQKKRLYLSPNAEGQIDQFAFERFFKRHRENPPKSGEVRCFEFCLGKGGEPYHWCSCKLIAEWEDKAVQPLRIIGKLQDITGIKEREEQLLLQSIKDGLTGVFNKTAFEYRVGELLKNGCQGWLCMMDIDNFKEINDHFGHLTGDRILAQLGGILCGLYPEPDLIGRIGGDEFVVFTAVDDVHERAETLLYKVENILSKEDGRLSVSIAIVSTTGKRGENYQRLFSRADRAMYRAKKAGKNRIAFFKDNIWHFN